MEIDDITAELVKHPTLRYGTRPLDGIESVVIHHSAGSGQTEATVKAIASQHVNTNGWPGIGYTFVINNEGYIWQVNKLETWSYHAGNHDGNRTGIGVCLLGNFTGTPPTEKQIQAAIDLRAHLSGVLGRSLEATKHQDWRETACPGATWPLWFPRISGEPPPAPQPTPAPMPTIDLLAYFRGDGRLYEVRHQDGKTETFQTQANGNLFYQTKNTQWEKFYSSDGYIWRGMDTSPGPAPDQAERPGVPRLYQQFEANNTMARWCKQHMAIGQTYTGPGHWVQFHYKDTCAKSALNSGAATNVVKLVAKHASKTWNGITVNDVVELKTGTGETMFFARFFGLVAWSSPWGESAISEIHAPGQRPPNQMEVIGCL